MLGAAPTSGPTREADVADEREGGTTMGKALMGSHVAPASLQLLDEVRVLRQRVADLERALAEAEAARDRRPATADDREPAHS
jgi:hypothetical protein